ncbi:MAG: glycosyltransferase family 9 protein [Ignavibacteriaceae bacterium]|nr:glycosyltransferase family 9 protein [Ignavibacteriaceae bacterium]
MEKILVIQTAFIGDAILTLPMIQQLKKQFPSSSIDVVCIPVTREIFACSEYVDEVIVLDKRSRHKSILSLFGFIRELKRNKYTRIYSPHRSFRTSLIVLNSGVRETFGFSNSSLSSVYKNIVEYKLSDHEVKRNLNLVGTNWEQQDWRILPEISFPVESEKDVELFFQKNKLSAGFIAVAPGSVWKTKKYPEEHFVEVVKKLFDKDENVVLIGSEREIEICERIAKKFDKKVFNAAGIFSIIQTIILLKKAKLLICNDSAPTHFGICADIPVLTLYCSTVPEFGFYPYNKKSSFISIDDLKCKPCGIHGYDVCPLNHFDCGVKLLPEKVFNKVAEMLGEKP